MVLSKRDSCCMNALRSKNKVSEDWMHDSPSKNAFHTWKAIEKLKNIIAMGACFIVGDGAVIDIWKDPWMSWLPNFVPQPKDESSMDRFVVSCLINQESRSWNSSMLEHLFTEESVMAIKRIPIPLRPRPDRLVWIADPKGNFSVQSVYKTCHTPTVVNSGIQWCKLWKLPLHERLKMLLWRIGSNILLTNKNFALRVGFGDTLCPLCYVEEESILHLFFHCPVARAVCFDQRMVIYSDCFPIHSCADIVYVVVSPFSFVGDFSIGSNSAQLFAIIFALTLECIWTLRNLAVHKVQSVNTLSTVQGLDLKILEHFSSFSREDCHPTAPCVRWQPSPGPVFKLNMDAAVCPNFSSIAVVARDATGFLLFAWIKHIDVVDPEVAEATAILWAVQLAKLEGFLNVIIESDSKVPIDAINSNPEKANWKISTIVSDVNFLAFEFVSCCFSWVKRDAKKTTHEMAKFVVSLNSYFSCNASSLPPLIKEAWQRDGMGWVLLNLF